MNSNARPWYFWPLIAFVVGLLIGWIVIGWGLWPVEWTNAQLQDLTPALKIQYVQMVSESYAQTRNVEVARQRLAGWPDEELAQLLSESQRVLVARDTAAAQNVQELSVALGLNQAPGTGTGQGQAAPGATAAPATGAAAEQPSGLQRFGTVLLFLLLAAGALAALYILFRRWRASQEQRQRADEDEPDFDSDVPFAAASAAQEKARWPAREPLDRESDLPPVTIVSPGRSVGPLDDDGEERRPNSGRPSLRPVGPPPTASSRPEPVEARPAAVEPTPIPPARATGNMQQLADNTAVYQMGEPDYDEAFDINDPVDGYMGQCGLQLSEPFGRERDQAVALQVWLWDSSDPDTKTLVLMSEGAYRDTALRSQHAGEHQAIAVRPGTEFELDSHDLLLRGRVEKVSYAEAEPPRGVFADLQVKLTVYRRS